MSKSYYEKFSDIIKIEGQSDKTFFVNQLKNCREVLRDAYGAATRDEKGKPIFFYVERPPQDSNGCNIVSLHYIDAATGEFRNLNFIANVLTGLRMEDPNIGLWLDEKKYKTGTAVIARLSRYAVSRRRDGNNITARRV